MRKGGRKAALFVSGAAEVDEAAGDPHDFTPGRREADK
jgi:hypothetical protein